MHDILTNKPFAGTGPRAAKGCVRVLQVVSGFGAGGTQQQFINLGLALDLSRFALEYGCLTAEPRLFPERLRARGVRCTEYAIRRLVSWGTLLQQSRLARYISTTRTQVIHTYDFCANVLGVPAAWLAGVPVIIASIRDRGLELNSLQRHLQRLICKLADCVLVNAESIKDRLVDDGYAASSIVVIRNGIEVQPAGGPKNLQLRKEIDVPEAAPMVVTVSKLLPKMGLEDFIDAAAILSWQDPDLRFVIASADRLNEPGTSSESDDFRQSIENRVRRLGLSHAVRLVGYRSDIDRLLADATVSVFPALNGGMSSVLFDSMATGVPLVATRVGGIPEVVEDGLTGLLVPPSDPQDLASAIGEILSNPARAAAIGRAARLAVRTRFGLPRMARAMEELYTDLLWRKNLKGVC